MSDQADFTNQRTRMEDPINGIVVAFYGKDGKNMLVQHNGTHDVCVKYCPIDPRDTLDGGKIISWIQMQQTLVKQLTKVKVLSITNGKKLSLAKLLCKRLISTLQ